MAGANGFGNLVGNFMQAFAQTKLAREDKDTKDKEIKVRTQLAEIELRKQQQRETALASLRSAVAPQQVMDASATAGGEPTTKPGLSITQALTNPEIFLQAADAGLLDEFTKFAGQQRQADFMERILGPAASGGAAGGGEGGPGALGGMDLTGLKFDSSGNVMPDFGLPQITTQTIQTPQGPRIQTMNARTGATMADLGAPPEANINANEAGRLQGLFGAQTLVADLKRGFINQDGQVNHRAVLMAFGPGVPWTEGRTLSSQFEDAADAVIRARTGATANVEEIQGIARQFKPNPLDSDETIIDKLTRFERFSAGALDAVTLPPRLRELAEKVAPKGLGGEFEGFEIVP